MVNAFALPGCYSSYVDSCLQTFWDSISVPSSRVRQSKTLEDGSIGCPETSVNSYQHAFRNISEDRERRLHRDRSVTFRTLHSLRTNCIDSNAVENQLEPQSAEENIWIWEGENKRRRQNLYPSTYVILLLAFTTHLRVFSLLILEVSRSHTMTHHSR